jgi:hypothetical protein
MRLELGLLIAITVVIGLIAVGCATPAPRQVPVNYSNEPTIATPTNIPTPTASIAPKGVAKPTGYLLLEKRLPLNETPLRFITNNSSLVGPVSAAMQTWNRALNRTIFGNITVVPKNVTMEEKFDGKNEIGVGCTVGPDDTVAETTLWPNALNQTIEVDIIFNANLPWGNSGNVYIVQNIATHELGHVIGLNDLHDPSYANETMYYATDRGETCKEVPSAGDVYGAQSLYNN